MPPLLSICIPTWNRAASLRKTLDSLSAALPRLPAGSVELCLSDNASTDVTPEVIREFHAAGIQLRAARLNENAGFSGNYWSVASLATARFIWITGDDDVFDAGELLKLIGALETSAADLVFLNSAPWKDSVKTLPDQSLDGLEAYFAKLGIFHGSFIGNAVFATPGFQSYLHHPGTLASAYPHMAPIFGLLHSGRCQFLNIRPVIIDDSSRSWRARQPLLTAIDMARLATDLAFTGASCGLATRGSIYAILLRSLPRAVARVSREVFSIDPANPYQSLSSSNLRDCYRAVPFAGPAACLIAALTRLAAKFIPYRAAD